MNIPYKIELSEDEAIEITSNYYFEVIFFYGFLGILFSYEYNKYKSKILLKVFYQ